MPGGDKRRAKKINKRLGRTQTISNTNKNRGQGTSKAKKRNTICNKWGCRPKRKTKVRSNTSKTKSNKGSKEETKISGLEITVSKDEKQNKGLSKILSGGKALPKLRAKLPSGRLGRRDKFLNINSQESDWGQHLDDSFSA